MGYTRQLGQLAYLITFDGSGNITVPASLTQGSVTSSMLKADAGGKLVAAVAGTDFVAPAGLSAYVPTTRTLTINGTTFDLSADRSWTIVSGVSSFNTRTGAITLLDTDVTGALGYTPVTNARTLTINGTTYDLSANRSWSIVAGISSFNTRTGDITLLDTDVTGALGYTPVTNARTITINGTTYDLSANRTWVVDTSSVTTRVIQKFTATSSQTTFTITGGYTVGMVDVFLNGIKLDNATEFTASNGSTVVLALGAATGDIVEVYKYGGQFIANNTLRQSTLFTATAGQTTFTVNYSVGFVDVFYNGSKLDSSEFTATNGTSIVLGTACVLNDKVEVVAYNYTVGAFTGVGGLGTTNYISKWTASGTLGNSLIFDNGTGVGIGTNSPNANLTVWTASTTGLQTALRLNNPFGFTNANTGVKIVFSQDRTTSEDYQMGEMGVGQESPGTSASGYMFFSTRNSTVSERMRITASGNVGIGTSSPSNKLDVRNAGDFDVKFRSEAAGGTVGLLLETANTFSGACQAFVKVIGTVGGGQSNLIFGTAGASGDSTATERMRITSGGNILIGSSTNNNNGIIQANGTIVSYASQGIVRATSTNQYNDSIISASWTDTSSSIEMRYNPNSAVAYIQNTYPITSGQVYGDIHFRQNSGGTMVSRMIIKADGGAVTRPSSPAFRAYYSFNGSWTLSTNATFVFDATEYNIGNCYNTSNGRFTAPVSGVYHFSFYSIYYGPVTNAFLQLIRNGGVPTSGYNVHFSSSVTGWDNVTYNTTIYLNAGDWVAINNGSTTQYHGDDWSSFSGYLVG